MDWKAEAKRIQVAFNLKTECEFVQNESGACLESVGGQKDEGIYLQGEYLHDWLELLVTYSAKDRVFEISRVRTPEKLHGGSFSMVIITWDGSTSIIGGDSYSHILARALFHLDLLTPEVEITIRATISAHEKLEWKLEYEDKM